MVISMLFFFSVSLYFASFLFSLTILKADFIVLMYICALINDFTRAFFQVLFSRHNYLSELRLLFSQLSVLFSLHLNLF